MSLNILRFVGIMLIVGSYIASLAAIYVLLG